MIQAGRPAPGTQSALNASSVMSASPSRVRHERRRHLERSPNGPSCGSAALHAPLGTLSQSRQARMREREGGARDRRGTDPGKPMGRIVGRIGWGGSWGEEGKIVRRGGAARERKEAGGGAGRGRAAADVGRGRRRWLWEAAARSGTASPSEDERAPRLHLQAQPSRAASWRAPAAPGATMALALWPRVSRILWLACLLPLAPAAVAAGKALREPAACPPPAAARPGPLREPGLRSWHRAPCAHLPPPPSPGTALRRGHGQLGAARPSPLSPRRSPQKSPRHSWGSPRPSVPPPDRPCPGNRARWPSHPSRHLGNSQPLGVGEDDAGTRNVRARSSRHSLPGGATRLPEERHFCLEMSPCLESLSTLFVLAPGRTRF